MSLTGQWRHICVDMQRMFAEETPWHVSWMATVLPRVTEIAGRHAERTVFTRFIPPEKPGAMPGTWRAYYDKWWMMTGEHLPREMTDVVPPLKKYVPPATCFDKCVYSPWFDGRLHHALSGLQVSTLVISGGETDVCVLATVMGAVDLGYRTIVLKDAVFSGADETHDASLELLGNRFSVQLELTETEAFLSHAG
ncbi:cysteine hydrolase [Pararhizobium sp. YC-54]|uniref:cysteine hydrolase family protein n=1 Tax=Pararhizobium sp. YC-54 TaxID=2986920 RepID=UPI0021F7816B|nr:isochorismatase family cysteine hydrolase [Pararhizobium sp. YC-54]MCV9997085.1 cysteine hydrolase [Pararhizobium sp. YC-54]